MDNVGKTMPFLPPMTGNGVKKPNENGAKMGDGGYDWFNMFHITSHDTAFQPES